MISYPTSGFSNQMPEADDFASAPPNTYQRSAPFNQNLMYYNTGIDQPRMWGGGRDPMRSGEFFAPTFALRNQAISGWMNELNRAPDTIPNSNFRAQEMGLSPQSLGYHPGTQRDLLLNQMLNQFKIGPQLASEAFAGIETGALARNWLGEHKLYKAQTPSNGFLQRILGIM